jgi:hypothetical protein
MAHSPHSRDGTAMEVAIIVEQILVDVLVLCDSQTPTLNSTGAWHGASWARLLGRGVSRALKAPASTCPRLESHQDSGRSEVYSNRYGCWNS